MVFDEKTVCQLCKQLECECTYYKCPCGKLETNCRWPDDEFCPCRICDELAHNCSCHRPLEEKDE